MAASTHVRPADDGTQPLLEAQEYDSYAWVLLEDHPLRSHPTACCPGIWWMLQQWYATFRKLWGDRIFSIICLLLMFGVMVQFLSLLPDGLSYLFFREHYTAQAGFVHWPAEFDGQPAACIAYNPRSHPDAIQYVIAAGCTGIKADIWLQDEELYVGTSNASLRPHLTLRNVYLDPLLQHLDAEKTPEGSVQTTATSHHGTATDEQFVLFLEFRSPITDGWPHLLAELQTLNERGYLTHRDDTKIANKAVTIVIVGDESVDAAHEEYREYFNHDSIFVDDQLFTKRPKSSSRRQGNQAQSIKSKGSQSRPSWQEWKNSTSKEVQQNVRSVFTTTVSFSEEVGSPHRGRFSRQQLDLIRAHVKQAHKRGLKARFGDIPCGSQRMQRLTWRVLVKAGADLIDVDWTGCHRQPWRQFFTTGLA
ncbi:hypothetical protein ASPACDRAFT_77726 [Aspergillus aculeatus ATCC 16872]|uniref:Altered inheritance of mitochondria protein 6 n=1 Tax=Aspergillus aculeatus (strain ATCC 16872 / CBS 172.66 / WB 5094) TaxID=690307 RepID=A0A1L9WXF4_ASPA1|nr:uncharacterized protein ASPACDRAFT_77726 [Aspergillus aculeatus ATCC 16872]OJK00844.1 hypothetical protein ASPACDRAFT_77726 [Aspergillus aculeatus ATCC 16872]